MAVTAERVVCGAAATALNSAETDSVSGSTLILRNTHATDSVVLGPSDVAAGTGYSLAAGGVLTLELHGDERIFGIRAAVADVTVHVLRLGV